MDLSWLDRWLEDVRHLNQGKVGEPYLYPRGLVLFLAVLRAKGFALRELEGCLRGLSRRLGGFPVMSYSQISRRLNKLDLSFQSLEGSGCVAIDGSGMKVTNRGEWIRHKWSVKKGWVKVVVCGDSNGNVVDVSVGNESLDERRVARDMIGKTQPKKVWLDGLHDTYKTYETCKEQGTKAVIPARKNSTGKGLSYRAQCVREQRKLRRRRWVAETEYGKRWPASEGIFSAVKRIFGETLHNKKTKNAHQEARMKFWAYQQLQQAEPNTA